MSRLALWILVGLFAAYVAEPYITRALFTAEGPRPIEVRSDLVGEERTAVQIFQRASPSVVHVFTQSSGLSRRGAGSQSGTGFVWDGAGHIVTNNHVVQNGRAFAVRLGSGDLAEAELVGAAPDVDLAVLRIRRSRTPPPPLAIGSSANLQVGQAAYAIGNPFGLDQTLTSGIISALQRRVPTEDGRALPDLIQTDAAINPGNSGGPLLDSAGRVIGVNTAIYSPSGASAGIGFAIPVDLVNKVVPEIIRTGRSPPPGIGIVAASPAQAAQMGIDGIVIMRTLRGSPAERAGLRGIDPATGRLGDIIVAVDGTPVADVESLSGALRRAGVGGAVRLMIERDGRMVEVDVRIGERQAAGP